MARVTKKAVNQFAVAVKKFMMCLGMGDWEITLKQEDLSELGDGVLAAVACDTENCMAQYSIENEWPESEMITLENVRKTALHEVLHALFSKYDRLAQDRCITVEQLGEAEHDVIRRLVMLYTEIAGSKK